jgi:hypothetical protein
MATRTVPLRSGQSRFLNRGVILGGGLAGIIGAILMGIAMCIYAAISGAGWRAPLQMIAATFYGPMAFVGAAGVTAIGVLTHLAIGALLGMVFAALTLGIASAMKSFWLGIVYSIAVWAFMTYVILAVFDATMASRVAMMPVFWFFVHWVYGAFTGWLTPGLRRALGFPGAEAAPTVVERAA